MSNVKFIASCSAKIERPVHPATSSIWERRLYFRLHILMYLEHSILCSENWTLRKVDRKCIESFEVWSWRRSVEPIVWRMNLHRIEEERNVVHKTKQRNVNWIGYILRRNCLPIRVIQINIEGGMGVTGGRRRRRKELLNDLKKGRGHRKVKEAALDRTVWRTYFGRVYELVRQRI